MHLKELINMRKYDNTCYVFKMKATFFPAVIISSGIVAVSIIIAAFIISSGLENAAEKQAITDCFEVSRGTFTSDNGLGIDEQPVADQLILTDCLSRVE